MLYWCCFAFWWSWTETTGLHIKLESFISVVKSDEVNKYIVFSYPGFIILFITQSGYRYMLSFKMSWLSHTPFVKWSVVMLQSSENLWNTGRRESYLQAWISFFAPVKLEKRSGVNVYTHTHMSMRKYSSKTIAYQSYFCSTFY